MKQDYYKFPTPEEMKKQYQRMKEALLRLEAMIGTPVPNTAKPSFCSPLVKEDEVMVETTVEISQSRYDELLETEWMYKDLCK